VPLPVRWRYKLDRWRGQLAQMFQSQPKQVRPRLCPSCGSLVGTTATKCYQCGANTTFSLSAASRTLSRWLPQTSPVTYALLTICCLMYVLSLVITLKYTGGEGMGGGLMNIGSVATRINIRLGASLPFQFNISQPWRFITAIFLHGSLLHIGFNMFVLMDLGPIAEEMYGSARFLFLYVVTGMSGYLVSSYFGHLSVGASGSLLGIMGLLLAATLGRKNLESQMIRNSLMRWLFYAVLSSFMPGTDAWAHIGGFAAGFLLGREFADRKPADVSERRRGEFRIYGA
jgi:membrane associated rhomboid family serine protease